MPSLLKEQRGGRKGGLRKENDKPQLFTKEIMLLLAWPRISEKKTVIWQPWRLYFFVPFQKQNVSLEARRGDRPDRLVPGLWCLLIAIVTLITYRKKEYRKKVIQIIEMFKDFFFLCLSLCL